MVRSELDWKNQPRSAFDWLVIVVAPAFLVVYLDLWWMDGQSPYLVMEMALLAWPVVYFTDYWQPSRISSWRFSCSSSWFWAP